MRSYSCKEPKTFSLADFRTARIPRVGDRVIVRSLACLLERKTGRVAVYGNLHHAAVKLLIIVALLMCFSITQLELGRIRRFRKLPKGHAAGALKGISMS